MASTTPSTSRRSSARLCCSSRLARRPVGTECWMHSWTTRLPTATRTWSRTPTAGTRPSPWHSFALISCSLSSVTTTSALPKVFWNLDNKLIQNTRIYCLLTYWDKALFYWSYLVVVNMYIAVVLENFNEATDDVEKGLSQDVCHWHIAPVSWFFFLIFWEQTGL